MRENSAQTLKNPADPEIVPADPGRGEIRLLDEMELMLAGGGEGDIDWP